MTTEEKARRYDEAIEKARIWKNKSGMPKDRQGILDDIFPELAESDDERIRKALLEMVHDTTGDELWVDYGVHKEDALAWLEKQCEHANFRNKIQIGDKVTKNRDGVLVNPSQLNRVAKKQGEQKHADVDYNPFDDFRKSDSEINPSEFDARLNALLKEFESLPKEELVNSLAFYLNVVQNDGTYNEQKPVWSEEDDIMVHDIDYALRCQIAYPKPRLNSMSSWIYKLKNRIQPKYKWSKEDTAHYNRILKELTLQKEMPINVSVIEEVKSDIIWFKSFKDRVQLQTTWKPSDLPHWKKSNLPNNNTTGFNGDYFCHKGYCINYKELFEKLPKDD